MYRLIDYQGRKVSYTVQGEGEVLLFVHGYLESSEIWSVFISRFTDKYKVLCIDVPGHGASEVLGKVHEMEEMARVIAAVLQAEEIDRVTLFGHSMGGYITIEFAHLFPSLTKAYGLIHSTCFADNDEKKANRDREISLILCGKKMQIIHTNIPKGFASDKVDSLQMNVDRAKDIAAACSNEGIVALLNGMKARKDHSGFLSGNTPPALIVWGKKDNYISEEVFNKMVDLAPQASYVVLKESGHMGFIEESDCLYTGILNFLDSLE